MVTIKIIKHGCLRMHTFSTNNHIFWRTLCKFLKHLVHFIKAFDWTYSAASRNQTHYPKINLEFSNACFLHIFIWRLKSCHRFQCHCPTAIMMYFKNLVYYVIIMILSYIWKALVTRPWNRTKLTVTLRTCFHKSLHNLGLQCLQ